MVCYLCNNNYNKWILIIYNIIIAYALYLTDINLWVKIIIFFIACWLNYKKYLKNNLITAFYLTTSINKSILLSKDNKQIKVNFIKVAYFSYNMIILCFANKLRKFKLFIFKSQVSEDLFKSLIILAKYNFLPNYNS